MPTPDSIERYTPETEDEQLAEQLAELAQQVVETVRNDNDVDAPVSTDLEGGSANKRFQKFHDITINQYLDYVRVLVENGMTFSAARAYAIEQYSDESVLGFDGSPAEQAALTGVSPQSHRQLVIDAKEQLSDAEGLYYSRTSTRPLDIRYTHTIQSFSDYTEGDFMEEHNPRHHEIRVTVGEYPVTPYVLDDEVDREPYNDSTAAAETDEMVPRYAVFFETYTGNGIVKVDDSVESQGTRLHNVEAVYKQSVGGIINAIEEKFEYAENSAPVEYIIEEIPDKLSDDVEVSSYAHD